MIQRKQCPVCDQPAEVVFARHYSTPKLQAMIERPGLVQALAGMDYEIRHCSACELHFQTWVMDAAESARWYSPSVTEDFFREEIGRQKLHWFGHLVEEILVFRQMCPEKVPRVLDFGCNWGKWASAALALGCDVYGVDLNCEAAAFCARRGIRMVGQAELPELRFDFINVDQVMEHLSDPLGVACLLAGCLKPGGFLKMSTPDNARLPKLLAAAQRAGDDWLLNPSTLDPLLPLVHVNLFSRGALLKLGKQSGLRACRLPLIKWLGAGQLWNIPRQLNRNLVVPFKRWLGKGTYVWVQKAPGRPD